MGTGGNHNDSRFEGYAGFAGRSKNRWGTVPHGPCHRRQTPRGAPAAIPRPTTKNLEVWRLEKALDATAGAPRGPGAGIRNARRRRSAPDQGRLHGQVATRMPAAGLNNCWLFAGIAET
jgi:hypothetical protein